MKVRSILNPLVVLLSFGIMASCSGPSNNVAPTGDNEGGGTGKRDGETEMLTPNEQKEKLNDIASRMMAMVNSRDQQRTLELASSMIEDLEYADWSAFEDMFDQNINMVAHLLRVAINPNTAPLASGQSFNYDDFAHTFTYNSNTQRWIDEGKSNDGSFTLNYKNCIAKLTVSSARATYTVSFEGDRYTVTMPKSFTLTLKEGNYTHINLTANLDIVLNDHVNITMNAQVANITWKMSSNVLYTKASGNFSLAYGSTEMINANFNVPSFRVPPYNGGDLETYGENIADDYENIIQTVGKATGEVDIFQEVQVKANISDFGNLFNAYRNWENQYDYSTGDFWFQRGIYTLDAQKKLANIFDQYCTGNLHYNSDVIQAQLKLEPTIYTTSVYDYYYEGYREYDYYDITPVIFFPKDQTSYEFGNYFTEEAFSRIIDMAENIMNTYSAYFEFD